MVLSYEFVGYPWFLVLGSWFSIVGRRSSVVGDPQRRADIGSDARDLGHGLGVLWDGDRRHARLDDPGLLIRDLRQSVAQDLHMVVADRGDDRNQRRDDVGAIVAAA